MKLLREITEWEGNTPNHIYALNEAGKMIGFKNVTTGAWTTFVKPMMFSQSRRKFEKLPSSYPTPQTLREERPLGKKVKGSNGMVYYVFEGTCTCPGFKFRGKCKHLDS